MHDMSHSISDLFSETTPELGSALFGVSSADLAPERWASGAAAWLGLLLPHPDGVSALYTALLSLASLGSPDAHTPILLPPIATIR